MPTSLPYISQIDPRAHSSEHSLGIQKMIPVNHKIRYVANPQPRIIKINSQQPMTVAARTRTGENDKSHKIQEQQE